MASNTIHVEDFYEITVDDMSPTAGLSTVETISATIDFDYIAQHKRETGSGKLTGDVPLQPAKESGTGIARDPELVALDEVIAQINDLFSGDHPDTSVRNVVTHIKDRLEESETLQQHAQNRRFSPVAGPAGQDRCGS
jgi:hypothetical protein